MTVRILEGHCLDVLRTLPDQSVHCCVTSPPYYALRDYGVDGQIGLEATPAEFIAALVDVFREVRRVLRNDGTLWMNLGDSYAGTKVAPSTIASQRRDNAPVPTSAKAYAGWKPKDLMGMPWRVAFALQQPWEKVNIKDRIDRAWLAALVDGEGCMTIMQAQNGEKSATSFPPVLQVKMCDPECIEKANQITGFEQRLRQDSPSRGGMRDTYQWRITGRRAADIAAEIYPYLLIKRKQATILWNHQMVRDSYETKRGQPMPAAAREKQIVCRQLIQRLNQKQSVDLPSWMVEPNITVEPGWYLRQDVIWAKPNPMPESIRDRCTKAHEYIFLMSKSARYWFDADSIKEPASYGITPTGVGFGHGTDKVDRGRDRVVASGKGNAKTFRGGRYVGGQSFDNSGSTERDSHGNAPNETGTRNRRSVWTVATEPFKEAHFATFPSALIEPCILAGCQRGGTVLDPFGGAGTTGLVADRLQRNAVLIELNPAYAEMARRRIHDDAPLLQGVA